jgi:hypothetical protein
MFVPEDSRNGRALLARNPRAEQIGPAAAPALDNTPASMLLSRGTESLQTRRWREMDSNFRFRCVRRS